MHYDEAGGHSTNPKKMTLLGSTASSRRWCTQQEFGGLKPNVLLNDVVAGDVVTTVAQGGGRLANRRVEHAIRGCKMVMATEACQKLKTMAATAIAIPRMLAISVWSRPA